MGWWDEGIMGGDTPLDYQGNFEDSFGSKDESFNRDREEDGKPAIPYVVPTVEQSLKFIEDCKSWKWHSADDDPVLLQVTGFLLMERGAPMSNELRAMVLEGIDDEITAGAETWDDPDLRIQRLQEFREQVLNYPAEGAVVKMAEQPGLFGKLAEKLGAK